VFHKEFYLGTQGRVQSGTMEHQDDFMLTSDAARALERSPDRVRQYERAGRLPAVRTAGCVRMFRRRDVERLARELRQARRSL
jgi:MerR HTH family regulatory protein